jgi:glycine cleavage system aminomethyltransferase T
MNNFLKISLLVLSLAFFKTNEASAQAAKYKCMIQMTNYMGEGAYIVISLIDSKGQYEKTLYVLGSDKKWYNSLK